MWQSPLPFALPPLHEISRLTMRRSVLSCHSEFAFAISSKGTTRNGRIVTRAVQLSIPTFGLELTDFWLQPATIAAFGTKQGPCLHLWSRRRGIRPWGSVCSLFYS